MRPAMMPISRPGGAAREPSAREQVAHRQTEEARASRQARHSLRRHAARERRARADDAPRPLGRVPLEHRADHDAAQAVAEQLHRVAGHARDEFGELRGVRFEPSRTTGSRTSHVEAARLEPPAQDRHHAAHHPKPVHDDDRLARAIRRATHRRFRRMSSRRSARRPLIQVLERLAIGPRRDARDRGLDRQPLECHVLARREPRRARWPAARDTKDARGCSRRPARSGGESSAGSRIRARGARRAGRRLQARSPRDLARGALGRRLVPTQGARHRLPKTARLRALEQQALGERV